MNQHERQSAEALLRRRLGERGFQELLANRRARRRGQVAWTVAGVFVAVAVIALIVTSVARATGRL